MMKVILKSNIRNLGKLGEVVTVRPGFGRNFLLPQGKAVLATPHNVKQFELERAELEAKEQAKLAESHTRAETLQGLALTIPARAGEEGRLFGSVGTHEIAKAAEAAGFAVAKHEVLLPDGPIRQLGDYEVTLQLQGEVTAVIQVSVVVEA